jgi:hypothetical protein
MNYHVGMGTNPRHFLDMDSKLGVASQGKSGVLNQGKLGISSIKSERNVEHRTYMHSSVKHLEMNANWQHRVVVGVPVTVTLVVGVSAYMPLGHGNSAILHSKVLDDIGTGGAL